jgi:hypothetical protein
MQRKSHLSGDAAQPCTLRHHDLSNQQYGRLLPVDSGHEKLRLHVLDGWKSKTTNFFALRSRDCIQVQAGPTEAFAILVPRPKTGMLMHTILPRLEKEKDVEPSWESCSFSLSRFAIQSGAKEE